eukprot:gene20874-25032_t
MASTAAAAYQQQQLDRRWMREQLQQLSVQRPAVYEEVLKAVSALPRAQQEPALVRLLRDLHQHQQQTGAAPLAGMLPPGISPQQAQAYQLLMQQQQQMAGLVGGGVKDARWSMGTLNQALDGAEGGMQAGLGNGEGGMVQTPDPGAMQGGWWGMPPKGLEVARRRRTQCLGLGPSPAERRLLWTIPPQ